MESQENVLWSGMMPEYLEMIWGPRENWNRKPEKPSGPLPRVRAIEVVEMARSMGIPKKKLIHALGFARGDIVRKAKSGAYLNDRQSELFHGLREIMTIVDRYYGKRNDDAAFNAARWMGSYLGRRIAGLGDKQASDFMRTLEGQEHVRNCILAPFSGVYL